MKDLPPGIAVNKFFNFNSEPKYTGDSVRNEQMLISKRGKKDISVLNFLLSKFPLWFNILNNLLIMDSFIGTIKYFVSCFFTISPLKLSK